MAGELRSFNVGGHELLAVLVGERVFCLEGRCSHAGAPLAEGTLAGEVLTCPWHYSQFNVADGSVLRGPAYKPLKAYPTKIKDNSVLVEL